MFNACVSALNRHVLLRYACRYPPGCGTQIKSLANLLRSTGTLRVQLVFFSFFFFFKCETEKCNKYCHVQSGLTRMNNSCDKCVISILRIEAKKKKIFVTRANNQTNKLLRKIVRHKNRFCTYPKRFT